jgi:CubicO group peptidase (beta-lactamase class C family)
MRNVTLYCLVSFIIVQLVPPVSGAFSSGDPKPLLVKRDVGTVIADLNAGIPDLIERARVPGLQIALIRDGKVVWENGFGVKSGDTGALVTGETIFEAASLTKPFFAYAVMKMVDKGIIDLDKPLFTYLPREQVEKELGHSLDAEGFHRDWFERITPRHVLSHSGGMPHGEGGETYPLFFEPGTKWKYSAGGYYFLQKVVEHIKGEPLETIIKNYILDPLGMKSSCMVWEGDYEWTIANGHDVFGYSQDIRRRSEAHAAASLYTTAGEYARFVCAVLNGEGLKKETAEEMITSFIDMNDEGNLTWSLGFGLQHDDNGTAFWQWGDYGIFRNYIIAYPEHGTGVVYLTNSFNGLSICSELVVRSIGGRALGSDSLGYDHYDSPVFTLLWDIRENGPETAKERLPDLMKQHPDIFTWDKIRGLGNIFEQQRMFAEAAAIYECNLEAHPRSGRSMYDLAKACLGSGDHERAKSLYRKALEAPEDSVEAADVEWAMDYIKALEEPALLDEEYLQKLAGDYETRHLTVKDGTLHYFRENTGSTEPRLLIPLSKETFVIEGIIYFKLRVEFDERGNPTKLIGFYENGYRDESIRNEQP